MTLVRFIRYSAILGFRRYALPATVTKTAGYTVTGNDYTIRCDATAAAFSILLPAAPPTGHVLNIKKVDGSVNAVTVDGNGKTIDGTATKSLSSQYSSLQLQYSGATWDIIGKA